MTGMASLAFSSLALRWEGVSLVLLDQMALPHREVWVDGATPAAMADHIRALRVRGAPLIGVAAGFSLASFALKGARPEDLEDGARLLRGCRPTAVNLMGAVDRVMGTWLRMGKEATALAAEAMLLAREEEDCCSAMAERGASLLGSGERVLTHCNTGSLATPGIGTALGVIRRGWELGKVEQVWVDETRPLLQGARLTAWELSRLGIPYRLITDGMAASLLVRGEVDRVLVGADRIALNGDFANKIGTLSVAISAFHAGVPFHPVAPDSTVDRGCPTGRNIEIEIREGDEVRGGPPGAQWRSWAPGEAPVWNPAFDVTPVGLLTSLLTDQGVFSREALMGGVLGQGQDPPRAPGGRK